MLLLPFDSHNHIHLGNNEVAYKPSVVDDSAPLLPSSTTTSSTIYQSNNSNNNNKMISGMAIMSTNILDFPIVRQLSYDLMTNHKKSSSNESTLSFHVIPCFGIHPWWLHELINDNKQWEVYDNYDQPLSSIATTIITLELPESNDSNQNSIDANDDRSNEDCIKYPLWINHIKQALVNTPGAVIGEIGLDGFHYDPHTKQLTSSMENQCIAFYYQMLLGYQYQRPVCIHCVQSFGPLLSILHQLCNNKDLGLPPKLYFHAFGGKMGTIDQIIAIIQQYNKKQLSQQKKLNKEIKTATTTTTLRMESNEQQPRSQSSQCVEPVEVYFGFAPVVNFKSNKTIQVMKHIGIHRMVLETDIEAYDDIPYHIQTSLDYISQHVFTTLSVQEIITITTQNAYRLYNIK